MTREEKISVLRVIRADYLNFDDVNTKDKYDALTMVIEALEKTCEDAISRQAVLDIIEDRIKNGLAQNVAISWYYHKEVEKLPSVTPKPKKGHWIRFKEFEDGYYHIKCSECGQYWSIDGHAKTFKYCFKCGAKMESEEI